MARRDSSVLILGGGAWGLSTALHMLNSGFVDITVIERGERIPSRYSAAWDLNKIVRAEYEDAFYTELALVSSSLTSLMNRRPEGFPSTLTEAVFKSSFLSDFHH